jgi:hypothetical protein
METALYLGGMQKSGWRVMVAVLFTTSVRAMGYL